MSQTDAFKPTQLAQAARSDGAPLGLAVVEPVAYRRARPMLGVGRRAVATVALALIVALALPVAAAAIGLGPWSLAAVAIVDLLALLAVTWAIFMRAGGRRGAGREAMLAQSLDASPAGQAIVNGQDRLIYANDSYRELVGAPRDGPAPTLERVLGADSPERGRLTRMAQAARAGGQLRQTVHISRDGIDRWLEIAAAGLTEDDEFVAWYVDDATARHRADQALKSAEAKLAEFVDAGPIGYCLADGQGRLQYVNRTLAAWLGDDAEKLAADGTTLGQLLAWQDADAEAAARALTGEAPREGMAELRRRDGDSFPVRVRETVTRSDDGQVERVAVAISDARREGQMAAALRKAEDGFRRFFDYAPVGVVTLDEAGLVSHANVAFKAMTEVAEGGTGQDWGNLFHADDRGEIAGLLNRAAEGQAGIAPVEVRLTGERERVAQLFATRLDDEAGGSQLLLHLIDTTEQKDLELKFAQSQKMQAVGQLAGGVAHDFNNLLTAMIGFCDLLLLRHPAGDPSFSDIMHVKQNANRAANLVRQLLAFSRQQTLRPKVLVVTDVLAELTNLLRRLIGENIELKIVHGKHLGPVKVDQGQFEQVIINLAVNARDAMMGGGSLTISTSNVSTREAMLLGHDLMPSGEYVRIEIADTGCGIPKEHIGNIYEPFFTTKAVGAGTGLGLSTVYGIIKQTGGNIFVQSEVGKGSTFQIYLPRYVETATDIAADEAAGGRDALDLTGKGTILLVEDEEAVRMFAARALQNKGYTVLQAESGETALEVMRGHDDAIELMISDVVMPNMDGPTLVQHARVERPDMKIIFISGYAEDAFRRNMDRAAQEIDFLPKPFSLKQLAGKVKDVLSA